MTNENQYPSLADKLRYSPIETYRVIVNIEGQWVRQESPGATEFTRTKKGAQYLAEMCSAIDPLLCPMVIRENTVFFSDMATREVFSLTEFSAPLV